MAIRPLAATVALLAAGVAAAVLLGEGTAFLVLGVLDGDASLARRQMQALGDGVSTVSDSSGDPARERARLVRDPSDSRVLHPFLGYVADPASHPGFNPYGLWGHPAAPDLRRKPGRLAVLVLGGSLAADFPQYGGKRLAEQLSSWAAVAASDMTFATAAYGGYKQPQQLFALAYVLALGGEVDVVVNLDGFNDVALDAAENGRHAVFPAYPDGWALLSAPSVDLEAAAALGRVRGALARRRATADALGRSRWARSNLAVLAWRQTDRVLQSELAEARRDLGPRPTDRRFLAAGPPGPSDPEARLALLADYWERSSLQLDRLCRANGIRYFHFLQPNQYVDGSKTMSAAERRVAVVPDHPYAEGVRRGYPLLRARGFALRRAGVAFHDLTQAFAGEREAIYVDDCCHVNERGYLLLADRMAALMRADGPPAAAK